MKMNAYTDPGQVIDPGEVEDAFSVGMGRIYKMQNASVVLDRESSGSLGFSKFGFNLNGSTPLYDKTIALISDIQAEEDIFLQIRAIAVAIATSHREIELTQLRGLIETELSTLRSAISTDEAIINNTGDYTPQEHQDAQSDKTDKEKLVRTLETNLELVNAYLSSGTTPTYIAREKKAKQTSSYGYVNPK